MGYAGTLKKLFPKVDLQVEDLLFLEPFQIEYLPDRVPKDDFAVLLRTHPIIHRYLAAICPPISGFLDEILLDGRIVTVKKPVDECCLDLLWEIADLIVYSKYPEIYDATVECAWDVEEVFPARFLQEKIVVEAGAGSGKLSIQLARHADTVFAVEPVQAFRRCIREKKKNENLENLFVVDGFLDGLPFPDSSVDVLITSNAIGWNLEDELQEIERVLRPKGYSVHLFRFSESEEVERLHGVLTSTEWNYSCTRKRHDGGWKAQYLKSEQF